MNFTNRQQITGKTIPLKGFKEIRLLQDRQNRIAEASGRNNKNNG
jgi:hypothetical protein